MTRFKFRFMTIVECLVLTILMSLLIIVMACLFIYYFTIGG